MLLWPICFVRGIRWTALLLASIFAPLVAQNRAPTVDGLSPVSSSGFSATYTITFSDPDGYQDLKVLNVLINNFVDGRNACYLAFVPSTATSGSLFLVDDAGNAGGPYAGMVVPGSGSVSNSSCTISGSGSSVTGSGGTLTLTLALTFSQPFAGDRIVFMAARDQAQANSGWQPMGTVRIPLASPVYPGVTGLSPSAGSGNAQLFTATFQDATYAANIGNAELLINKALDGRSACYIAFVQQSNSLFLVNDAGDAGGPFAGGFILGTAGASASNSQCTVLSNGTTASVSGQTLTLALNVSFKAAFSGRKIAYLAAQTASANSDWHSLGAYVVGAVPAITDFNPKSGPFGTLITLTGSNLGSNPTVTLAQLGGGAISAPVSSATSTSVNFVIPAGAATGVISLTTSGTTVASASALTVVPSGGFSLTASPSAASAFQGFSVSYSVKLAASGAFAQLAQLGISGLPAGVTASFKPAAIGAGQTSVLTVAAPANQPLGASSLVVSAMASVDGLPVQQNVPIQLTIAPPTTSFIGRTVVDDALQQPLAGVTVRLLGQDGNGKSTGCAGQTVSDASGNFALTNLPANCVGQQLIAYDGLTVTSPPGKYAGVNIVYSLVSGQVLASPVLVHLPRIDDQETFYVQQGAPTDQTHSFASVPGLTVTVYKGTTFTMPDGSQPNPFPLVGVQVPVDRLPDYKPPVPAMISAFIVAFQPANARASQPVAVYYPNSLNTAPGTNMTLMTLDPTKGKMVPYGTGSVSADARQIVPDLDPAYPGKRYGIINFDWHGPMPPPPPPQETYPDPPDTGEGTGSGTGGSCGGGCCSGDCPPQAGEPVDLATGLQVYNVTDLSISGGRGGIAVQRIYRTLNPNMGPFGRGTQHNYNYLLQIGDGAPPTTYTLINPDNSRQFFSLMPDGSYANATAPSLAGAKLTRTAAGVATLRYKNGRTMTFEPDGTSVARIIEMADRYGNRVTINRNPNDRKQVISVSDPVGRQITFSYDGNARVSSITDPIGRTVSYTYTTAGDLANVTDPDGGLTQYTYDSSGRLLSMTNARGVQAFLNEFDSAGKVVKQTQADGGVLQFSYRTANSTIPDRSPVLTTVAVNALGYPTIYRFDPQGKLITAYQPDPSQRYAQPVNITPIGQPTTLLRNDRSRVVAVLGKALCATCGNRTAGDVRSSYDDNGNLLTSTDELGNTTSYTYEPVFNQLATVTNALGQTHQFFYL